MASYTGNGGIWEICLSINIGFACTQWTTPFGAEIKTGDYNGDGKTDMVFYTGNGGIWWVCLSTGTGFSCSQWTTPFGAESKTGDYNGDGKTDMVFYTGNGGIWWVCLSTGTGFACTQWTTPFGAEIKTGDYNGDGRTDMVFYTGNGGIWWVCLSKGNAFSCNQWTATGGGEAVIADFDGDGKTDHATYTGSGGIWNVNLAGSGERKAPDSLATVLRFGVQTTFTYKPMTDSTVYGKGSSSTGPYVDVQAAIYVVSNTSTSNGIGGFRDFRYYYFGAVAHVQGGGMMGFSALQVDDVINQTVKTTYSRTDWPYQGFVYASQSQTVGGAVLSRVDSTLAAQSTYTGVYFMYTSEVKEKIYTAHDGIVGSTGISGSTQINLISTVTEFAGSPQYGNATKITVTDIFGPVSTTVNNYELADLTNWNIGKLSCSAVTKTQPGGTVSQTRTSRFGYETSARGFLLNETIEPGTSCIGAPQASTDATLRLTTTYGYDSYGNTASVTVSGGMTGTSLVPSRTTINSYVATATNPTPGRFATSTTVANGTALSQTESREFDNRFGGMTKLIGPNGAALATTWQYDSFGRKFNENRADGTATTISYAYMAPAYTITTATTGAPTTSTQFDILNRPWRTYTTHFDNVRVIGSGIDYDSRGRVSVRYRNFLSGATTFPNTIYTYDILGRVRTSSTSHGLTTTYGYNKDRSGNFSLLSTTVAVSNSTGTQTTATVTNARGQVTSTIDSGGYTTGFTYAYGANGILVTTTTDPLGNKIVVTEDLAGRKIALTDPDMGAWIYTYDALGQLKSQRDAKLQTSTMVYDLLGRMTQRSEPSLISNYYYDKYADNSACNKGIGKLCEVTASGAATVANYRRKHYYDNLGRGTRTDNYVEGTTAFQQIDTTYGVAGDTTCPNSHGKVCSVTYPAVTIGANTTRLNVKNNYNAAGYLSSITNVTTGATEWTANAMDADGHVTSEAIGKNPLNVSGMNTLRTYESTTGRLKNIDSTNAAAPPLAGGTTQKMSFGYDTIGNLINRTDAFTTPSAATINEIYTYDALNRLKTVGMSGAGAATLNKSYNYDEIGNIIYKSDLGGTGVFTYPASGAGSVRPHAVTSVNGTIGSNVNPNYTYDANGNMITAFAGTRVITYESFNMPRSISRSGVTVGWVYDADHNRIKETYQLEYGRVSRDSLLR